MHQPMSPAQAQEDHDRRTWVRRARKERPPPMPRSLRVLLEDVNSMVWQLVVGLKGMPPRSRVYRMGVFRADGVVRSESAEVVRLPSGAWAWSAWVRIPEIVVELKVGGFEPTRKYAIKAADAVWKTLMHAAVDRAIQVTQALRQKGTTH